MNENNSKVKRKPTHININSNINNIAEPRLFDYSLEQRSTDTGISPTYYTDQGDAITTSGRIPCGSPVYDDSKRIFFPHHSSCVCKYIIIIIIII